MVLTCLNRPHPDLRHSLIRAYFPELPEDQQRALLFKWVPNSDKSSGITWTYLGDVLDKLGTEEDGREFQELKAKIDEKRRIDCVLSRVPNASEKL